MVVHSREKSCQGRGGAVLIGINYAGTESELRGCEADVDRVRGYLKDTGIFSDVTMLTEGIGTSPTRQGILAALEWVGRKTHSGISQVVIQYSGHGLRVRDDGGDEKDGQDEAWYTTDGQVVRDDEIRAVLNTFSPWCRVLILVDACHSGTGLDLPIRYVDGADLVSVENVTAPLCDVVMISGCLDSQTSADAELTDDNGAVRYGGAMTEALFHCMPQSGTVFDLVHRMSRWLSREGYPQRPQLSSSRPLDGDERISRWLPGAPAQRRHTFPCSHFCMV